MYLASPIVSGAGLDMRVDRVPLDGDAVGSRIKKMTDELRRTSELWPGVNVNAWTESPHWRVLAVSFVGNDARICSRPDKGGSDSAPSPCSNDGRVQAASRGSFRGLRPCPIPSPVAHAGACGVGVGRPDDGRLSPPPVAGPRVHQEDT